jgi:putative membrane protein|tara:strand:+ start:1602 stop:2726 length:1125 start_codon:yes stop_codon:yes gene_type:complete
MVRTLVLTIDRDNDLGVKAAIRGPVIGRKPTITAAIKLGIADPEESDTNAILGALHHYDRVMENVDSNDEVEVAILTGDVRVGPRSDRAIASQLDEVIKEFQPDVAILVTDGADDEASMPIITSRVRVDHVEKIIVRQSKGIESTYYYIAKAIDDPRWRAKLLVPISIFLMIIGLGLILPNGRILIGIMPLIVGIWILSKGLGWEEQLERLMVDLRDSAQKGIFSSMLWAMSIFSVFLAGITMFQVFSDTVNYGDSSDALIWTTAVEVALQWLVVAVFTFALAIGAVRWGEGTYTGRSMILAGRGAIVYTIADASLGVLITILSSQSYIVNFETVSRDWDLPLFTLILYYLLKTAVESITKDEEELSNNKFWGV